MFRVPGTIKLHRLQENLRATELTLAADDFREIYEAADALAIYGAHYPQEPEATTEL